MAESINVPYKTFLPEGMHPGSVLRIRGVLAPKPGRFYVDLLCRDGYEADAVLHFNPRTDTSTVVFNTKQNGAWGREERGKGVPFQCGQPFEVLIIATSEGFKIVVGDSVYHYFRYRIPPETVRLLGVGGNLELKSVHIF